MAENMTARGIFGFVTRWAAGCVLLAALAGCSQTGSLDGSGAPRGATRASLSPGSYSQCVPYARDVSGVQIFGDAWTWWGQAQGRYERGATPTPQAVLTLRKTQRLSGGHVAVVAAILEPRRILVDHANWGDNRNTRGKVHTRQPVIDVSPDNDWSAVRFMNTQGTFGAVYPAYGFIYADRAIHTAKN